MKKLLTILTIVFLATTNISQWLQLNFDFTTQWLLDRFMPIHFMGAGNNYAWAIFWFTNKSFTYPQTISLNGEERICQKMIRGMYFNNARWQKIFPLDPYTLDEILKVVNPDSYNNLSISGGLYTSCYGYPYGIYGQIEYNRSGDISYVTAWTDILYQTNRMSGEFTESFEIFSNQLPLGYITDNIWGIGFVGGVLTGHQCLTCLLNQEDCDNPSCAINCSGDSINELFVYSGTEIIAQSGCNFEFSGGSISGMIPEIQWAIKIQGNIGLSNILDKTQRQTLLGNTAEKTSIINMPNINTSTFINQVKKTARNLCRGNNIYQSNTLPTGDESVVCFGYDNYNPTQQITIDLVNHANRYRNKTIIVKNADVFFSWSMNTTSPTINIFVDNGNIFLRNHATTTTLQDIDQYGYPTTTAPVTKGFFIKGNIIINWLLMGTNATTPAEFKKNWSSKQPLWCIWLLWSNRNAKYIYSNL